MKDKQKTLDMIRELTLELESTDNSVHKMYIESDLSRYFLVLGRIYYDELTEEEVK